MRILAGEARGRIIKTRDGNGTRPTDARARETMFNIVGARTVGARVLDLYAGSGSLGLEALSRGAQSCLFIEQNAQACRAIGDNVRALGWENRATIWQNSVQKALQRLTEKGERFDLVFADPPFDRASELPQLGAALDNAAQLLHNGKKPFSGLLIVQHHWKAQLQLSRAFERVQERRAGESLLVFCEVVSEPDFSKTDNLEEAASIEYSNAEPSDSVNLISNSKINS